MRRIFWVWMALAWAGMAAHADILIGQVSGFTGPTAAGTRDNHDGAELYFKQVNAAGGVRGQMLRLLTEDDQGQPARTVAGASRLRQAGVVALTLTRGTPNNEALLPWLDKEAVPMVAPSSGAHSLLKSHNGWVFPLRPFYREEVKLALGRLRELGFTKVAVIAASDSFGDDGVAAVTVDPQHRDGVVRLDRYDKAKPDLAAFAQWVKASEAQALLFIGSAEVTAKAFNHLREQGSTVIFATLSNNASAGFVESLSPKARRSLVLMQSFPGAHASNLDVIRELKTAADKQGVKVVSPSMVEGFLAAKILVLALRAMPPGEVTATGLALALRQLGKQNLGGITIDYGRDARVGSTRVDIDMLNAEGRVVH